MSLIRHSALAVGAAIVVTGSRFALAAIVARRVSPEVFGQFAYAQWLVDFVFLVCSLGTTGAVSRYAAELRAEPGKLAAFIQRWRRWALLLPLLAGAAVALVARALSLSLSPASLLALCGWTFLNGSWAMQTASLTGFQRFERILLANAVNAGVILFGALIVPVGNDPWPLFATMALGALLAASVGLTTTKLADVPGERALDSNEWAAIRTYSLNIWFTALLWSIVWSRGEFPIVRHVLGETAVAQYAAAMTLLGGAIQGVMLATSGVSPQLTRLWGTNQKRDALELSSRLVDMQLLVAGFGAIALSCFGPELLTFAFGAEYEGVAAVLRLLGLGLIAMSTSSYNHLLQLATDARFTRNVSIAGTLALLVLALFLTQHLGLEGAAISRAFTMGATGAVALVLARHTWGREQIRLRNPLLVTAVAGSAAVVTSLTTFERGVYLRSVVFLVSATLLCVLVRDRNGRLELLSVVDVIASRLGLQRRASTELGR